MGVWGYGSGPTAAGISPIPIRKLTAVLSARYTSRVMPRKHIAYYKVLEALDSPGCPICSLVNQSVRRRMDSMLYEQVNDPGTRRKLIESRGFCRQHSSLLLELGHPLGVAIIYRDIVDSVSAELASGRSRRNLAKCPACTWAEHDEQQYLSTLADHFADPDLSPRILGSRDLCLPHLKKLLEMLPPSQQPEFRQAALSHLAELKAELSEIVRKSDYRCEEPFGPEGDAWIRAVAKLSGCVQGRF